MKIFGVNFITKNEIKNELASVREVFPFNMGEVVYDVALKNKKGQYSKSHPSLGHCEISEVTVTERNYFSIVNRYNNHDVFRTYDEAVEYIKSICK